MGNAARYRGGHKPRRQHTVRDTPDTRDTRDIEHIAVNVLFRHRMLPVLSKTVQIILEYTRHTSIKRVVKAV